MGVRHPLEPSQRPRIVVTRPLVGDWCALLQAAGDVVVVGGPEGPDRGTLLAAVAEAEAVVCLLTDRIDAELLEAAPRLRVIGNCAVGVDNVDVAAARRRGLPVCHTPGILTDATADLAMALLLAVARRLREGDALVRAGEWTGWRPDMLLGLELRGSRLGVVGLGRIGKAVARRAVAFGMEVVYWSRQPDGAAEAVPARYVSLDELLATSDAVSLHVPLRPETHHLLDGARLRTMKPGALLVNTARGAIVDEAALVEVLREGPLCGAGLDVFEAEPELHPGLLEHPRVVLLPHLGSATAATRARMAELVCRDVVRVLRGEAAESAL
jgi:glyoxylate reductase